MSAASSPHVAHGSTGNSTFQGARAYFWSDTTRALQTVLGLIWLLDGGLQFQAFMYTHGFPAMIVAGAQGQPGWLHDSIIWGAKLANGNLDIWNTLFALTQVALGVGLLYKPTVKLALAGTFAWAVFVWWFGEAFGMLFMNMAQPMTGAPGGVIMYALVGLVIWPGRRGGLLGIDGSKILWAVLWFLFAFLWLTEASASANATSSMLTSVDSGVGFINSLQSSLAGDLAGEGLAVALLFAVLCAAIAAAPWIPMLRRDLIWLSIVINLAFWIVPQGLGGIFAGGATDPNTGPLLVLLACAMLPLVNEHRSRGNP